MVSKDFLGLGEGGPADAAPPVQRVKRLRDAMSPSPLPPGFPFPAPWNPEMGFSSLKKGWYGNFCPPLGASASPSGKWEPLCDPPRGWGRAGERTAPPHWSPSRMTLPFGLGDKGPPTVSLLCVPRSPPSPAPPPRVEGAVAGREGSTKRHCPPGEREGDGAVSETAQ